MPAARSSSTTISVGSAMMMAIISAPASMPNPTASSVSAAASSGPDRGAPPASHATMAPVPLIAAATKRMAWITVTKPVMNLKITVLTMDPTSWTTALIRASSRDIRMAARMSPRVKPTTTVPPVKQREVGIINGSLQAMLTPT